jgi:hypothetical protein
MKKIAILVSVLMLIGLVAGGAMAKGKKAAKAAKMEAIVGEVVSVDVDAGQIVIMAGDKEQTLKAEPKLLEGIAAGEKVNIEKSGNVVKAINKAETPPAIK